MINWQSFLLVALASIGFTTLVVSLFSFGMRLLTNSKHALLSAKKGKASAIRSEALNRFGAYGLFALCAFALIYGIYLIVPYFHI
ncbi:MAG: hypothetical protein RLZZ90_445 [Actinomycetota bacterium]|jgi:hypothetical protein